ncbi:MAG: HAMP domain-containing histidine kinase [Clostridia bacterium]|nr:HAMP domain-containing histidine kinase [Clostridia bacterium]
MKHKRKDKRIKYSLFSFKRFVFAFCVVGFVVTVSFLLFLNPSWFSENVYIPVDTIKQRAISTFFNILFLCLTFAIIDSIRRSINFGKPLEKILDATREITNGNFKVRLEPIHRRGFRNELDVIMEDFNKMAEELDGNATMKNDFIADVSHEFKTPLSVIQNYATMLQDPELDEEKKQEYARVLCDTSKNLSELVSNILKLNKLENQQIFPEKKPFNLSEQLCECMLVYEAQFEKKKLEIELDLDENLIIKADYDLLMHVWHNLFSNAIKFNCEEGKIFLKLERQANLAVVKVRDTGCGMTEETSKHIFEKFYQGDTSRSTQGNGLGLALVKRVIDITGGDIQVQSEVGKGTEFIVFLPLM